MIYRATLYHATPEGILHQDVGIDAASEEQAERVANAAYPNWGVTITNKMVPIYLPIEVVKFLSEAAIPCGEFKTLKDACEKACQKIGNVNLNIAAT